MHENPIRKYITAKEKNRFLKTDARNFNGYNIKEMLIN